MEAAESSFRQRATCSGPSVVPRLLEQREARAPRGATRATAQELLLAEREQRRPSRARRRARPRARTRSRPSAPRTRGDALLRTRRLPSRRSSTSRSVPGGRYGRSGRNMIALGGRPARCGPAPPPTGRPSRGTAPPGRLSGPVDQDPRAARDRRRETLHRGSHAARRERRRQALIRQGRLLLARSRSATPTGPLASPTAPTRLLSRASTAAYDGDRLELGDDQRERARADARTPSPTA